ncbi:hypothetical protein B4N84_15580 [Flavobacterium sp. IR1]|nr:hypothetical protein B4N84_15580 [Flavobacterium sp. IR1]
MKVLTKLIFIFFVFVLTSCKKDSATINPDDSKIRDRYFNLEKIGWKSHEYTQKVEDIGFIATEVPIQYYLLKDLGNENLKTVDSIYETNKRERVIEFVFQHEEEKDLLSPDFTGIEYTDAIKYISFSIDKDFYAVTSKNDTILCSGVTYERTYKIAPYQKVLLFFSGIDPNEKIQLIYNDFLFKKGILKFNFKDTYTPLAL